MKRRQSQENQHKDESFKPCLSSTSQESRGDEPKPEVLRNYIFKNFLFFYFDKFSSALRVLLARVNDFPQESHLKSL